MTYQHSFARCSLEVITNLFTQLMEAIARRDTLTFNEVFIEGATMQIFNIKDNYIICWRKET